MRFEESACVCEDVALYRAQQHIFEHRIVGDEEIWACCLNLVAGEQFRVLDPLDRAQRISIAIHPVRASLAVPIAQAIEGAEEAVGLPGPAPFFPQGLQKRLVLNVAVPRAVLDLEIIFERLEPLLVAIAVPHPGIERAACITAELGGPLRGSGEPFAYRGRAEQGP